MTRANSACNRNNKKSPTLSCFYGLSGFRVVTVIYDIKTVQNHHPDMMMADATEFLPEWSISFWFALVLHAFHRRVVVPRVCYRGGNRLSLRTARSWFEGEFYVIFTIIGVAILNSTVYNGSDAMWGNEWFPTTASPNPLVYTRFLRLVFGFYLFAAYDLMIQADGPAPNQLVLAHHLVTLALVGIAISCGYTKIGTITFLLHNVADIFLEGRRLSMAYRHSSSSRAIWDVLFVVSWMITRICVFPVYFMAPAFTHSYERPEMSVVVVLFSLLYAAQWYWTVLIWRGIYRLISSSPNRVASSNDEEDDGES